MNLDQMTVNSHVFRLIASAVAISEERNDL